MDDVEQSHNYAFWSADGFSEDQYSQVTLVNIGNWNGVIVRAKADVDEFYLAIVTGDNNYSIFVRTASGYTLLAAGSWKLGRLGISLAWKLPAQVR